MTSVNLGEKMVGHSHPCFLVAEIGINHNGDINIAKQLIDNAVDAGFQAVKFQKRTVAVVYSKQELEKSRENPFGNTNGDLKRALEFDEDDYDEIASYCREKKILWTASPWDEGSVDFFDKYELPFYKVASASLTDDGLLRHIRSKGKPIILSTGMSTMDEVDHAVDILGKKELILLHTVSTYPSKNEDVSLGVINTLKSRFNDVPIGYSGHEHGVALSLCAVALGACVVERHITQDRAMWGSDQSASLELKGMKILSRDIRAFEVGLGDGIKKVIDDELPIKKKLRRK